VLPFFIVRKGEGGGFGRGGSCGMGNVEKRGSVEKGKSVNLPHGAQLQFIFPLSKAHSSAK